MLQPFYGLIVPYPEVIGYYSKCFYHLCKHSIVPYPEVIGNYSNVELKIEFVPIVPYPEVIGNYSLAMPVF